LSKKKEETVLCQICKGEKRLSEVIPAELVRQPIVEIIKKTILIGPKVVSFVSLISINSEGNMSRMFLKPKVVRFRH
jgi:hypothetical protein